MMMMIKNFKLQGQAPCCSRCRFHSLLFSCCARVLRLGGSVVSLVLVAILSYKKFYLLQGESGMLQMIDMDI